MPTTPRAAADVFALPDYTRFADALDKIVLGECGGTVTLQTKNVADNLGAKDPFTYQNSTDNTVVKTSAAFKSGTFDVAFPGENAKTITITPQELHQPLGVVPRPRRLELQVESGALPVHRDARARPPGVDRASR